MIDKRVMVEGVVEERKVLDLRPGCGNCSDLRGCYPNTIIEKYPKTGQVVKFEQWGDVQRTNPQVERILLDRIFVAFTNIQITQSVGIEMEMDGVDEHLGSSSVFHQSIVC